MNFRFRSCDNDDVNDDGNEGDNDDDDDDNGTGGDDDDDYDEGDDDVLGEYSPMTWTKNC